MSRRVRKLDNRGVETTHLIFIILGIIAAISVAAIIFYLFHGIKTKIAGFGTVIVSASGNAPGKVISVTINNELNVPIQVVSISVYSNGRSITLSNCKPSMKVKVPAGQEITIVCSADLISGSPYTVVVEYKTPSGHTSTTSTTFVAS